MKMRWLLTFAINISFMLITACGNELCSNDIVEKIDSPDNSKSAVIFIRACGATTSDSYHLSILEEDQNLSNEKGNIYISQGKFEIDWSDDTNLHVSYYSSKIFKQETEFQDVKIEYEYKKILSDMI
ncbi:hypothetical protein JJQ72_20035 [Paenibacillus sp. F411]|uniref:hypothetical protein n=1 Tax=Paenibacillus sp. F411 TaxID=2820239 RepID=UPI001AAE55B8|nr:hypothetical protein [Paenibacillus sp. F411]MBO2946248.1 hypothetical protein [Paenibacillus sp. F411]